MENWGMPGSSALYKELVSTFKDPEAPPETPPSKPVRIPEKHWNFAWWYVRSGNKLTVAYKRTCPDMYAKYKDKPYAVWHRARQLMSHIQTRRAMALIQETLRGRADLTLAQHVTELERISRKAEKAGDFRTAAQAIKWVGEAAGFYTRKIQLDAHVEHEMSVEDRLLRIAELATEHPRLMEQIVSKLPAQARKQIEADVKIPEYNDLVAPRDEATSPPSSP